MVVVVTDSLQQMSSCFHFSLIPSFKLCSGLAGWPSIRRLACDSRGPAACTHRWGARISASVAVCPCCFRRIPPMLTPAERRKWSSSSVPRGCSGCWSFPHPSCWPGWHWKTNVKVTCEKSREILIYLLLSEDSSFAMDMIKSGSLSMWLRTQERISSERWSISGLFLAWSSIFFQAANLKTDNPNDNDQLTKIKWNWKCSPLFGFLLLSLLLRFILLCALVEKFLVHFHEELESIVNQPVDCFVPVGLAVLVQRWKHDRQDHRGIVTDQGHYVFIVPVVEGPLGNLKLVKNRK